MEATASLWLTSLRIPQASDPHRLHFTMVKIVRWGKQNMIKTLNCSLESTRVILRCSNKIPCKFYELIHFKLPATRSLEDYPIDYVHVSLNPLQGTIVQWAYTLSNNVQRSQHNHDTTESKPSRLCVQKYNDLPCLTSVTRPIHRTINQICYLPVGHGLEQCMSMVTNFLNCC